MAGVGGATVDAVFLTGTGAATTVTTTVTTTLLNATGGDPTDEINAASRAFGNLSQAANYGVQQATQLKDAVVGTGLRVHHIIEQRLALALGQNAAQAREWLSVAVTPQEHQIFTNAWRSAIGYSNQALEWTTKNATPEMIWQTAQDIYKNYPALLDAARTTIFGK